jgi:DNA-binding transcriptional LysR family regulator
MLDVRRLHVLSAVVEAGSVTAAAAELGYTASAISQSLAALERETGAVLFEKSGRGIRPTQAGLLLAEHASAVIDRLREAEAALEALQAGEAGRLNVAAFATAGASLVPKALARFRAGHRAMELRLEVVEPEEAMAGLRAGRIDVAVVTFDDEPEPQADDVELTQLLDDPYRVVLPADHRLANRRTIDLADLAGDQWIATASARCNSRQVITNACSTAGFRPEFSIEADEFATALGFVSAGLGVALLPQLSLSVVPDNVRVRRIRGEEPFRRVFAATRQSNANDVPVRTLVECLREAARSSLSLAA